MKSPIKFLLSISLLAAGVLHAADFTWDRVNVGGGGMTTGVLVHPAVNDLIYSRQDVAGLLRWDPKDGKWVQPLDWMPLTWEEAMGCAGLVRFALGAKVGQVYALDSKQNGLRFFDGRKWSIVPGAETASGTALATSPEGWVVCRAGGSERQILFSSDWGQTWKAKKSTFEPANWLVKNEFVYPSDLNIAQNPHLPGTAYFGDSFGIQATGDLSADPVRWKSLLGGLENTVAFALSSPPVGSRLYYSCADVNGFVWDEDISRAPGDQLWERVYANDKGGVGPQANWGIGDSVVSDVEWAPSDQKNQVVLRSTWKSYFSPYARIYRSKDAGKTREAFSAPPANKPNPPKLADAAGSAKLAISATDPNRWVYVRPCSFPVFTTNGFTGTDIEWKASTGVTGTFDDVYPYHIYNQRLAADVVDGMRFYMALRKEKQFRMSEDGGAIWVKAGEGLPKADLELFLAPVKYSDGHGELWVSTGKQGLFVSRDGGKTFQREASESVTLAKAICWGITKPGSKNATLYLVGTVSGREDIYYSPDFGKTFTPMTGTGKPEVGGMVISDMVADGREWGRVYLGTGGTGVVCSTPVGQLVLYHLSAKSRW